MKRSTSGFTLVEVMVAIVILMVGVIALAGSSGMVTRMVGEGRHVTVAVNLAELELERLRQIAASTSPRCGAAAFKNGTETSQGVTATWTVPGAGDFREVSVAVTYATPRGPRTKTIATIIPCS